MSEIRVSRLDELLARVCGLCPLCRRARKSGGGIAFGIVGKVETKICPFCIAYERVHGRKAHEGKIRTAAHGILQEDLHETLD